MRLKKITALFLTGALILSMAGCAGNGSKDKKEGSAGNEQYPAGNGKGRV